MPINRVQFQRGLSMAEFYARYGSEAQCEQELAALRWPEGFRCPACGASRHTRFERGGRTYWQCSDCRHQTTVTAGTVFQSTKVPLTGWFLAMHLLAQAKNNVAALALMRHLGVSYKTAWLVKHKLLQVMHIEERARQLGGQIVLSPSQLGNARSRRRRAARSGKTSHFFMALQIPDKDSAPLIRFQPQRFTYENVACWARHAVAPGTALRCDGLAPDAQTAPGVEQGVIVARGARQRACSRAILSNLHTAISGTYHGIDFEKYGHRYLAEAEFRFNRRNDLCSVFPALATASAKAPPLPAARLRRTEPPPQSNRVETVR